MFIAPIHNFYHTRSVYKSFVSLILSLEESLRATSPGSAKKKSADLKTEGRKTSWFSN